MPKGLIDFNASENDLSRVVLKIHRRFPSSSFFSGNAQLHFPNSHLGSTVSPMEISKGKSMTTVVKVTIIVTILLAVFIHSQESLDRFVPQRVGVLWLYQLRISCSGGALHGLRWATAHPQNFKNQRL